MKIIVVGVNHAGTSAIRTLLAQNPQNKVTAYDRNDNISFLGCGIALAVSGIVKDMKDLFYSNPAELQKMGASVFMRHEVMKINTDTKTVVVKNLDTNEMIEDKYDKLVVAAGSWPICTPGAELNYADKYCGGIKNLVASKTYQHAQEIIRDMEDPAIKRVAIIGAGYIGIELAEAAMERGKETTLIDLLPAPAAHYYDHEISDMLAASVKKAGVHLMVGTKVEGYTVNQANKTITGVQTDHGKVEADLVIQSIGFHPNTSLLPNAKKVKNGAIIVNEHCESSIPDVYVIGGMAALYNAATGQHMGIDLATNAVKTGIAAACHINGAGHVALESVVGTNAIHVFGNHLASTGISEDAAKHMGIEVATSFWEDNDRPEWMNTYDRVKCKLVFDKQSLRLLGAQIGSHNTNHTETIYYLALAIQKKMTLIDLAFTDVFFLPHYNKPFNFVLGAIMQALGLNYFKG
ncbi:FAD-dependent oxidoreductase [[Mycoplasma] testudinis]|uniref:FAD-dependent oxidoreductase n=1 Tax=[Mycoplasma] testudinis TaxID=33924 RepID=UPI000485628A|nr:FAD-dependent oxidoreductase [[Mycoplasma] testudinis]